MMDFAVTTIDRDIGRDKFDSVAGGETAGIAFAAWVAERLNLPMQYVRKKAKGFGRNAQIEGELKVGQRVLLVEDLATDGRSKVNFVKAIRDAGGICDHCFVIFFYDIYPEGKKDPGRSRRHAACAHHLVGRAGGGEGFRQVRRQDAGRSRKVHERPGRLVEGAWRRRNRGGVASSVMPGLVPGIHAFLPFQPCKQGVDGRDKPGHDD